MERLFFSYTAFVCEVCLRLRAWWYVKLSTQNTSLAFETCSWHAQVIKHEVKISILHFCPLQTSPIKLWSGLQLLDEYDLELAFLSYQNLFHMVKRVYLHKNFTQAQDKPVLHRHTMVCSRPNSLYSSLFRTTLDTSVHWFACRLVLCCI